MKVMVSVILVFALAAAAHGEIVTQNVPYRHGDVELEGFLAYDDAVSGKAPGVLVVHEWWGLNDFARSQAERLAALGYVAFALDMYGKGVVTGDPKKASELSKPFRGLSLMRERARAGLTVLLENDRVDPLRVAAIGFCFGGTTVLELAYGGAPLAGVVSFHGSLPVPGSEDGAIAAKVLVLHGADDPFISADEVHRFQEAMRSAGLDWQMVYYGGAVHSFTNPGADRAGLSGVAYHEKAAGRSWEHMKVFFRELFGG